MRAAIVLSTLVLVALSGCTTTLETSSPSDGISKGYSYQLPRTVYDMEVKRMLADCPDTANQKISFTVTAAAAARLIPGETVVVNYLAADSWTKTTDLAMKNHPNGMLKSINLTVDDRTADVAKELVKAAVGIGKIAIGLPGGGAVAAGERGGYDGTVAYLRCAAPARKTLLSLPDLKAAIKTAEAAWRAAAKELAELEAASKAGQPAKAKDLAELAKVAREKAELLEKAKKSYDDAVASLTLVHRTSVDVSEKGIDLVLSLQNAVDGKVKPSDLLEIYKPTDAGRYFLIPLTQALKPDISEATAEKYTNADLAAADRAKLQKEIDDAADEEMPSLYDSMLAQLGNADAVAVAFSPDSGLAKTGLSASGACATSTECGVLYRAHAMGRMRICSGPANAKIMAACRTRITGDPAILFHEERPVPQFGRLMSLPLINGPFANNALTAEFSEDGRITSFSYKKPSAEATAAVGSLNEVVGGATELITYKNGRELQKLKDQKALYEAQLARDQALGKLTPTELQQLKDQKDLVEAQISLAEAQTRAQPQQPSQVTQINNETALIEAQLQRTRKLMELRKAEKELEDLKEGKDAED